MTRKENFYLLFYKKSRLLKSGEAAIYMRISCNGTRMEFPTGKSIEPNLWSQTKEKAKGNSKKALDLNEYIDDASIRLFKLFQEMQEDGSVVTARELYNRFFNIGPHKKVERMIIGTFHEHNQECRALMGRDFELGTIKKYETVTRLLQRYIKKKYEAEDLPLTSLDRDFIHGFEMYLKIDREQQQNTVARYMKAVKKITNRALANEWITKNPFAGIKVKTVQTDPTFLSLHELHLIYEHPFTGALDVVRDMFIMAAFTGLAFIDISNLRKEHVVTDDDGNMWIRKPRQKTEVVQNIPLLDIPKAILKKYEGNKKAEKKGTLLPVPCNQVMNRYLKEIGTLCGIEKILTTHVARHTYATVTLSQGVRIENVSKMLGHTSIKMTQHYARVLDSSILEDMQNIREAMAGDVFAKKGGRKKKK
ncbi:site-specific integrase [Duncaniella muris]|uniref:site-specific integrase n=1 Tax=Duncaniella muris TaxID=2094150 RepID=UPI002714BB98|nr:site-specific integrase [Duncaniella muris]